MIVQSVHGLGTRRDYTALQAGSLRQVVNSTTVEVSNSILNFHDPTSKLAKILIPRAVGSRNLTDVQNLIRDHFSDMRITLPSPDGAQIETWHMLEDVFTADTPYGLKEFTNLVFTHDPLAEKKLVVAAHVDSKFFEKAPHNGFVGATDSAAPCGMMLDMASALTPFLDQALRNRLEGSTSSYGVRTTLQFVFFDGEEAFKMWTNSDSIYGARSAFCTIATCGSLTRSIQASC
jgi:hypothetical protein